MLGKRGYIWMNSSCSFISMLTTSIVIIRHIFPMSVPTLNILPLSQVVCFYFYIVDQVKRPFFHHVAVGCKYCLLVSDYNMCYTKEENNK